MAARALAALALVLALLGAGYWWGHTATDNAWTARQARAAQAARVQLDKETARADQAGANYLSEHLDQEDRYAALNARYQDLLRRTPLVVYRPVADAASGDQAGPAQAVPPSTDAPVPVGPGVPVLTLAAVRVWNGALAGADQAAGACGPPGPSGQADAACAAPSGLTLADAWANHAINAQTCAADRHRYQRLIDYLNEQPK